MRTAVLLAALGAGLALAGVWSAGLLGLGFALVVAGVLAAVAFYFSDRIALRTMSARPVSEVEQPRLYRIVRELSTRARLPMPRVYVSPMAASNAFATGRNPRLSAVCCTLGLLNILDERQLRAVVAHELAHIRHRDTLISSVTAALASLITGLASLAWLLPLGAEDDDDDFGLLQGLMFMVLGPVAATLIQLAVTRNREYRADAAAAELTGDPEGLASALRAIELGRHELPMEPSGRMMSTAHLMIVNPFRGGGMCSLFSTHPATRARVRRLERMSDPDD
ncbi:M48 family metalloprotease [Allonocardiopsis opalescens]|nr:M48 family metalloprotease [Allonocardiopsis opalescens]